MKWVRVQKYLINLDRVDYVFIAATAVGFGFGGGDRQSDIVFGKKELSKAEWKALHNFVTKLGEEDG